MSKLDRIVELYKSKYAMNIKDFLKFMYQKVDSPLEALRQAHTCILEEKLKINDDEIKRYLNIISALQRGLDIKHISNEVLADCTNIKFSRKPKLIEKNVIQVFPFSQEKYPCNKQRLNSHIYQQKQEIKQKMKRLDELQDNENELFQILNDYQTLNEQSFKINIQSSFFQNQSSVELLCQDGLLHLFEGNILHGEKKLKKHLIEIIQNYTSKQIDKTKFIYEYSPKTESQFSLNNIPNLSFISKSQNNQFYAIIVIDEKSLPNTEGIVICLNNKKIMNFGINKPCFVNNCFMFHQFEFSLKSKGNYLNIQVQIKNKNTNASKQLQTFFQSKLSSLPLIQNYQLFSIQFK